MKGDQFRSQWFRKLVTATFVCLALVSLAASAWSYVQPLSVETPRWFGGGNASLRDGHLKIESHVALLFDDLPDWYVTDHEKARRFDSEFKKWLYKERPKLEYWRCQLRTHLKKDRHGYFNLELPFWLIALLFAAFPILFLTTRKALVQRRADRRAFRGLCIQCGYNLTGNESGKCPECGHDKESASISKANFRTRSLLRLLLLALMLLPVWAVVPLEVKRTYFPPPPPPPPVAAPPFDNIEFFGRM